jgi:hypothetical protein
MAADIHIIEKPHTYLFDTNFTRAQRRLLSSLGCLDLFTRSSIVIVLGEVQNRSGTSMGPSVIEPLFRVQTSGWLLHLAFTQSSVYNRCTYNTKKCW